MKFPSQRGTIGLCLCAKTASHAHLLPRKECSSWCQGKAYALKSPGCQGCGGSKTIPSPGWNLDSWSVPIMLWEGLAFRPRSKRGFTLPSGPVIWQTRSIISHAFIQEDNKNTNATNPLGRFIVLPEMAAKASEFCKTWSAWVSLLSFSPAQKSLLNKLSWSWTWILIFFYLEIVLWQRRSESLSVCL